MCIQPQYTQSRCNIVKMFIMGHRSNEIPKNEAKVESLQQTFLRSVEIMARLRAPGGCPWDREQTFDTIRRYTLEETYEVMDAIEKMDWSGLKDELGDLFLQILFYAEMAQEAGYFRLQDVIENLNAKLIRRHPHVFGAGAGLQSSEEVLANWEQIKQSERAERSAEKAESLLDQVPRSLPALMEAGKLGDKAGSIGFDWSSAEPVFDKLAEEIGELRKTMEPDAILIAGYNARQEEELGDILFTVVNLARKLDIQPELALRGTNAKFRRRFQNMEASAGSESLKTLTSEQLEMLWNNAKAYERKESGN